MNGKNNLSIVGNLVYSQKARVKKKMSRQVKIGDVIYPSIADAGRSFGKSACYVWYRVKSYGSKMPDGTPIELKWKGEDFEV